MWKYQIPGACRSKDSTFRKRKSSSKTNRESIFSRLRKEAPVHYCPESAVGAYWSVTKYNDIIAVDSNHKVFSSVPSIVIGDPSDDFQPPMFIAMDPPIHDIQRKAAQPAVAPEPAIGTGGPDPPARLQYPRQLCQLTRNSTGWTVFPSS
jgi:cytochrome P450